MIRVPVLLAAMFCAAAAPLTAQSGGFETLTGEMLFASGTRLSVSHSMQSKGSVLQGSSEIANSLNRSYTEHRTVFAFDYGAESWLTLTALVPMVSKSYSDDTLSGSLNSAGLGDLALLGKVQLLHDYWKRSGYHVAASVGVEAPTGDTGAEDGGARLSPGMQTGSGSWDPFVSLSANLELNRWRFDAIALYKDNTEGAQNFEDGDDFGVDLIAAYRYQHMPYPGPSSNMKLGLLYRHEGQAENGGVSIVDSGSHQWLGRVGFAWHPRPELDIGLNFFVPLAQDYRGTQLAFDYRVAFGIGIRF